ncbi:MAG: YfhO family protein [Bacilli bacterium]|nr:YfhO family protein [Bacilli bacterium]
MENANISLKDIREGRVKSPSNNKWVNALKAFFKRDNLLYYFVFIYLIGVLWAIYGLINNYNTTLYNWDYNSQYVTMTYDFYDTWHRFFATGHFELYSPNTYLGTDNFGSNAYYGLFDPFLFLCYIFPRVWIPQTFAYATFFKVAFAALAMRAYLKYMGLSERTSRFGGLIYAFSGFINFFVGFPSFVSMAFSLPIILLGIEKVIKEKKILTLVIGLFFLGLTSFFFLVTICVWGAMYAAWRYFCTIKKRDWKNNLIVIGLGILGFAVGIMLTAWTLLPSVRESNLSGRTASIGKAYLDSLLTAIKTFDVKTFFERMFQLVGDNPGRELIGLASFFFPTANYTKLPVVASSSYDSWTSSLFCYTPMVILFFVAFISSIRRKKWSHIIAVSICAYMVFTTFAYYFFTLFAGDGYGRWFIVLIPSIIYYGCQELERLKDEPKWVFPSGALFAMLMTGLCIVIMYYVTNGKTFSASEAGHGKVTYWSSTYTVPFTIRSGTNIILGDAYWMMIYQLFLVGIESMVIFFFANVKDAKIEKIDANCAEIPEPKPVMVRKKFDVGAFVKKIPLQYVLMGFVAIEVMVAGNISFEYGSMWNYKTTFLGGATNAAKAQSVFDWINNYDSDDYFRTYTAYYPNNNSGMAFNFNGTGNFHSLFNYDLAELSRYSGMINGEYTSTAYNDFKVTSKSWSAYYGHKRMDFDTALGMKYYVLKSENYSILRDGTDFNKMQYNVPFGSKEIYNDGTYFVYENPYMNRVKLGHAVDTLYAQGKTNEYSTNDNFYSGSQSDLQVLRNENVYNNGAIVKDADIERLNKLGFSVESSAPAGAPNYFGYTRLNTGNYHADKYRTAYKAMYAGDTLVNEISGALFDTSVAALKKYKITDKYEYGFICNHVTYDGNGNFVKQEWFGPGYFLGKGATNTKISVKTASDLSGSVTMAKDFDKIVIQPNYGTYFNEDKEGCYFQFRMSSTTNKSNLVPRIYIIGDTFDEDGNILEEDTVLSYEWSSMDNFKNLNPSNSIYTPVFGFYAHGRAKAIVFCDKNAYGTASMTIPNYIYFKEYSDIMSDQDRYASSDYNLQDVVRTNSDLFTFKTQFDTDKIVVTSLGYDAGWKVTARRSDGTRVERPTFKLDGGFVGFVALGDEKDVTYTLKYETPLLKEGVILSMLGVALLAAQLSVSFFLTIKKKKGEDTPENPA